MRLHRRRSHTASLIAAALLTPLGAAAGHAAPTDAVRFTTVFSRGEDGYHTYRTPAIVKAADGSLLAFATGKVNSASDDGDNDLVLKRSFDGGATWGPLQVLVDDGPNKFGNPVPIVDRRTGRVVVNTTRTAGHLTEDDIRCGRASEEETRRSFVLHSEDHGATWSQPVEITAAVKPANWRHFVGSAGHGMQLTRGEYAGRLVIPGNHSIAPPDGSNLDCLDDRLYGAHSLYSDDGGTTWRLGAVDTPLRGVVNPNESTAAELPDGTVYFNARDQWGSSAGNRAATTSSDGGASFDAPYRAVSDLVAPTIQGSVLSLSGRADQRERVLFSAPGHPTARENLTLWSSFDAGATWQRSLLLHNGPSGYSDLVELDDHPPGPALGVLFENGERWYDEPYQPYHHRISFARVPVELLDRPQPPPATTPDESGHGNDSLVSGSPRLVSGVHGSASQLTGDYVELPLTDSLTFDDRPFTAAGWFRTTRQGPQAILWAHATRDRDPKWWVRLEPDLNRVRAQVRTERVIRSVAAPGNLADGQWHHVALTRDEHAVTLYVDGVVAATAEPAPGSVSANAQTGVRVGARTDGVNNPLVGAADEVWLFGRALTAAEISTLADQNAAPAGAAVAHLPLDQIRPVAPVNQPQSLESRCPCLPAHRPS